LGSIRASTTTQSSQLSRTVFTEENDRQTRKRISPLTEFDARVMKQDLPGRCWSHEVQLVHLEEKVLTDRSFPKNSSLDAHSQYDH